MKNKKVDLFLDSGAFSAWSKGVTIDIDEYINFIKEHQEYISYYSVLDSIGDAQQTLDNQKYMEQAGVNPIPCFHYGESIQYLKNYLDKYEYISLGGMVPISNRDLILWLDDLFSHYLVDAKGYPTVKVHGFGMTSLLLMLRYPWYSVDSTSWVLTSRFGSVYVPRKRKGKYVYDENSWKVTVSIKSPSVKEEGKHILSFTSMERNHILEYFDIKGYKLGKSHIRTESSDYTLKDGERWFGKEEADSQRNIHGSDIRNGYVQEGWEKIRQVETVIESGLCNEYKLRDELNIIYFLDLEKSIPEWPWPFKLQTVRGFNLI